MVRLILESNRVDSKIFSTVADFLVKFQIHFRYDKRLSRIEFRLPVSRIDNYCKNRLDLGVLHNLLGDNPSANEGFAF